MPPPRTTRNTQDSATSPINSSSSTNRQSFQIKQEPELRRTNCTFPVRRLTVSQDDSEISAFLNNGSRSESSTSSRATTPLPSRPMSPDMRRVIRDSLPASFQDRPATPYAPGLIGRVQCTGRTMKGQQCKNAAVPGTVRCRMHN